MAPVPEHLRGHINDSAGQPWTGRTLSENPWANDDGSAPQQLARALVQFHEGTTSIAAVVEALRETRLLIPLVARLGESGTTEAGVTVDKSADLSIVTVQAPDGRGIVPMFSSVAAMQRWDASARPVPVASRQAALSVVEEGNELIVLDPGSDTETVIRRPAVWAIARGLPYQLAWQHERVIQTAEQLLDRVPELAGVDVLPGDPRSKLTGPEVLLLLHLPAGLDASDRAAIATRVQGELERTGELVEFVDSLTISFQQLEPSGNDVIPGKERRATKAGLFRRMRSR